MRHITDGERRARLVRRQLSPADAGDSVADVAAAVGFLHGTEPANIYLSLAARSTATRAAIDRALFEDRTLVRQLAMRRTVFAFPRALFPAVRGSAAARVADQLAARLAKEVQAGGLTGDGPAWVARVCAQVREAVAEEPLTTAELRACLPELALRIEMSPGKSYGGTFPVAPRVLSVLAADGSVLRGRNAAGWKVSRPYWTAVADWLGEDPGALDEDAGYVEVVRVWLDRFGPGTEDDLVWWLGATKSAVRRALTTLEAVEVGLDQGRTGWLLPTDTEVVEPTPGVALLPVLDPTTMGWKERDFYLGDHGPQIFDRSGNAGATAWVDGRVVGTWTQTDDGTVVVLPLEELGGDSREQLAGEARRISAWLDGEVVRSVYTSPRARAWAEDGKGEFPHIS